MTIVNSKRDHILVMGKKIKTSHLLSKIKSNTIHFTNNFGYLGTVHRRVCLYRTYFLPMDLKKILFGSEPLSMAARFS